MEGESRKPGWLRLLSGPLVGMLLGSGRRPTAEGAAPQGAWATAGLPGEQSRNFWPSDFFLSSDTVAAAPTSPGHSRQQQSRDCDDKHPARLGALGQ